MAQHMRSTSVDFYTTRVITNIEYSTRRIITAVIMIETSPNNLNTLDDTLTSANHMKTSSGHNQKQHFNGEHHL